MNEQEIFSLNNNTTLKTINNIKKSLKENLQQKYNIVDDDIVAKILTIHGLNKDNFDFVSTMERLLSEKLNDVSIDDNSNKNETTIEGLFSEISAPIKKAVGYDYLHRQIKLLYGKKEADRLMGEMIDYSLALSDSSNILKVYCFSLDASKIVTCGRDFGVLHSKPAKRVSSYISALCETVHQLSSHLAGAIAIGTFFLDIAHLLMYNENVKYDDLFDIKQRKQIENEMQQFVHSVNHLSRNGQESPFTNVSIFDREKLKVFLEDDGYGWYFSKKPDWNKNYTKDDIIDYIIEIQNIFLDFFDKGDPIQNGLPYRFPVTTLNISKNESGQILDRQFVKNVCDRDIFRYNIFASEGTKIASCCRLISNIEMMEFAAQANSFAGGAGVSIGSHRVCTINFMRIALECKTFDEFIVKLNSRIEDAGKILKSHKQLIDVLSKNGLQQFVSNGWINSSRLFSTWGILGITETINHILNTYEDIKNAADGNNFDSICSNILTITNEGVNKFSTENGLIGNIEQIPAESMAHRLPKVDKLLFGEENNPYVLYSNQFIPLWEKKSIYSRLDEDGKFNSLITGGGIVHCNVDGKITSFQAEHIIKYAIAAGCEHFAINAIYSKCEAGHVSVGKLTKCPICNKDIVDKLTRVVGFLTPVSSWNAPRREWEFDRRFIEQITENSYI